MYDGPVADGSLSMLIDRLWPRGVQKTALRHDAWLKDVAPSPVLRRWFDHDPARWAEFRRRYRHELQGNRDALTPLLDAAARALRSLLSVLPVRSRAVGHTEPWDGVSNNSLARVPPLYFHPHDYDWIGRTLPQNWETDIRVWRSVGIAFTKALVANNFLGTLLLRIIYWLEDVFPHALARLGRYPTIVIRKTAG